MKLIFSISFLIAGLPILFIIREFIPLSKSIFTYLIIAIVILSSINFKNLLQLNFFSRNNIFISILILILFSLFLLNIIYENKLNFENSESFYIVIILLIYISTLTNSISNTNKLFFYVLILSSITSYLTVFTSPMDLNYWILNAGGRLYVGDTKNPNISSFVALINVLSIIIFFSSNSEKKSFLEIIFFIITMFISIYIYYLSFSKSAIIGLLLSLFMIGLFNLLRKRKFIITIILCSVFFIIITFINPSFIENFNLRLEKIFSAFYSYFFGITENIAGDSAAIRNLKLKEVLPILFEINIFTGNGIFTTRSDFPLLQTFTDLGYFPGILNLLIMFILPMTIIINNYERFKKTDKTLNNNFSMILYVFFLPNLFLHGTPYETSIWIPILVLLHFNSLKRHSNE